MSVTLLKVVVRCKAGAWPASRPNGMCALQRGGIDAHRAARAQPWRELAMMAHGRRREWPHAPDLVLPSEEAEGDVQAACLGLLRNGKVQLAVKPRQLGRTASVVLRCAGQIGRWPRLWRGEVSQVIDEKSLQRLEHPAGVAVASDEQPAAGWLDGGGLAATLNPQHSCNVAFPRHSRTVTAPLLEALRHSCARRARAHSAVQVRSGV